MSSAATPAAADQQAQARRRRHAKPPVTRRSAFQLLVGVLIVGAIPIVSTVRILQSNALRNEQSRADSALRSALQSGLRELGQLSDAGSMRADDLARSPSVQRAVIRHDVPTLRRIARTRPGVAFYIRHKLVAGTSAPRSLERSVWLTVNGSRVAKIASGVVLDRKLARRLTHDAPHGPRDLLVLTQNGRVIGGRKLAVEGRTVTLRGIEYRGVPALVQDADGVRLLALRPEDAISDNVRPYQQRVRYAALGSFSLLIMVAFLFAGPILRVLGDFRRISSQATTDSLTGLANRRTLDEELALEWRRADRVGNTLAFVLLDLDDFKRVNDTHGHQAGDAVLRKVGEILGAGVRQVDLAGRYGGEEFALILPETDLEGAVKLAERLRVVLESTPIEVPSGETLQATASFGVGIKESVTSPEELVAVADEALYAAKDAGKNRVLPELGGSGPRRKPERRKPKRTTAKRTAAKPKPKAKPAEGEI